MAPRTKTKKQFDNVNELIKLARKTINSKLGKKEKLKSLDSLIKQVKKYINSIKKQPKKQTSKSDILKRMENALIKGEKFDVIAKEPTKPNILDIKKDEQKEDEKKSKIILQTRDITPISKTDELKTEKLIDTQKTELNKLTQNLATQQKLIEDKSIEQVELISDKNDEILQNLQSELNDLKQGFSEQYEQFSLDARNAYFIIANQLAKQQEAINKFTIAKIKENTEVEKLKVLEKQQEKEPEPTLEPLLEEQKVKEQQAKEQLAEAEQQLQEINEEVKVVVEEQKQKLSAIESANLARGKKRQENYELVVKRAEELVEGGLLSDAEKNQFVYLASNEAEQKIAPDTVLKFMDAYASLKEQRQKITLDNVKKQFTRYKSIDQLFATIPKSSTELNEKTRKFNAILANLSKLSGKGIIKKNIYNNNIMKPSNSVYELTNAKYGSQYNQVMQNMEMKDRLDYEDGSIHHPELQIKSSYNKVVGSGYNKRVKVPAPNQALERVMSLFYTVGIDGIGRLLDGVPQHDDYIIGLEVYPLSNKKVLNKNNMSNYVGGKLFKDTQKTFNLLSKHHKMNKNNKLKELERVLTLMSKKYKGGSMEPPENNSINIENYELNQPKEEETEKYKISVFSEDLPEYAPPEIRQLLKEWGDAKIIKARICRVPLNPMIKKIGNLITKGKLEQQRIKLGYNDLFHLYIEVALKKPNGNIGVFAIEKNQKAGFKVINGGLRSGSECINQPPTKDVSLSDMFKRAEKAVGANKLWVYSLDGANCQDFAVALLGSGNGMLTAEGKKFALQSPSDLLPKYILTIVKGITDLANKTKSFIYGKGKSKKHMKGGVFNEMTPQEREIFDQQLNEGFNDNTIELEGEILLDALNRYYFPDSQTVMQNINEVNELDELEYLFGLFSDFEGVQIGFPVRTNEVLQMLRRKMLIYGDAFG